MSLILNVPNNVVLGADANSLIPKYSNSLPQTGHFHSIYTTSSNLPSKSSISEVDALGVLSSIYTFLLISAKKSTLTYLISVMNVKFITFSIPYSFTILLSHEIVLNLPLHFHDIDDQKQILQDNSCTLISVLNTVLHSSF